MPNGHIVRHKPENRWVACMPQSGLYLGDVTAEEIASALEEYARAIRAGSEDAMKYPPDLEFAGKTCVFRRAHIPKLDPIHATQGVG